MFSLRLYYSFQFRLDFRLCSATALSQKVLTGHRLLWIATKDHLFLGSTESQKNRLLWEQSGPDSAATRPWANPLVMPPLPLLRGKKEKP